MRWTSAAVCGMLCDLERRKDRYGIFLQAVQWRNLPDRKPRQANARIHQGTYELAAASEKLEKSLTPEQSDLFYAMKNAKAEVETLLQAEAYRMGFIDGLEMKKDIETNGNAAD